ncbi:MAG TPA: guanylate kinase [Anaerolineaceae bacterium]
MERQARNVMETDTVNFDVVHPNPLMIVISGPSGVGKDAILDELRQRDLPLHFVVTATSRPPRAGEIEGVDYFFVSKARFEEMMAQDELLEYAVVYLDYKGVPKSQVREALKSGKDVILRVDVQGARRLRSLYPDAVLIFIVPHDQDEWEKRLKNRDTETEESYRLRVQTARKEVEELDQFDYVVVNAHDRLDAAVDTIMAIIVAEHHRVEPRKIIV